MERKPPSVINSWLRCEATAPPCGWREELIESSNQSKLQTKKRKVFHCLFFNTIATVTLLWRRICCCHFLLLKDVTFTLKSFLFHFLKMDSTWIQTTSSTTKSHYRSINWNQKMVKDTETRVSARCQSGCCQGPVSEMNSTNSGFPNETPAIEDRTGLCVQFKHHTTANPTAGVVALKYDQTFNSSFLSFFKETNILIIPFFTARNICVPQYFILKWASFSTWCSQSE